MSQTPTSVFSHSLVYHLNTQENEVPIVVDCKLNSSFGRVEWLSDDFGGSVGMVRKCLGQIGFRIDGLSDFQE